jgi:nucleolar protein 14
LKRESKYNLSDDDEDEINVHNMLSEKDDFDEEVPLDDGSDEEGTLLLSLWLEYNPPQF